MLKYELKTIKTRYEKTDTEVNKQTNKQTTGTLNLKR